MVASMTAFASLKEKVNNQSIVWEIKTLNHKYTDYSFKLPENLRQLECKLISKIQKSIQRGKVECILNLQSYNTETEFELNEPLISTLNDAFIKIKKLAPIAKNASVIDIFSFPGVLISKENSIQDDTKNQIILNSFDLALEKLITARNTEGKALEKIILNKIESAFKYTKQIENFTHNALLEQYNILTTKCQELCLKLDSSRLEQEVAILVQKLDIREELDRITTHINEAKRVIQQTTPIGKNLDFLMQEMLREANTIAAKSQSSTVATIAIKLKIVIDQAREQIQNIE